MKHLYVAVAAVILTGCASSAAPRYIDGNYYMVGDANCRTGMAVSPTMIMCGDKSGAQTGYRNAMTAQDMQMYQMHVAQYQATMQQIQQVGQTWQNAGNQITQQSQSWTAPQVTPIAPQGSGATYYRQVGNTWMGSNGASCQVVGQAILCSDGKRCQQVGQNLICN